MNPQKRKIKITTISMTFVCLLAIWLSTASIFSIYQLRRTAEQIYSHPYTVSNEARSMQTRLWDMRSFLPNIFNDPHQGVEDVKATLNERYSKQYASVRIITNQYLGGVEDTKRLKEAMEELEAAQTEALPFLVELEYDETIDYIQENLYPKYDAVSDALSTIIAFADKKVEGLEKTADDTAKSALISSILLTVFLPAYFLVTFWRERKSTREIRYREHLFDLLSTSIDDMFFIYNKNTEKLEYVSDNTVRLLGVTQEDFSRDPQALRRLIPEEDLAILNQFNQQGGEMNNQSAELRLCYPSGEYHWVSIHIYPEIIRGKVSRYIAVISDQTENIRIQQTLKDALFNAQNANAAKQNFLSRMSHEIRTPMNAIIGMTAIAGAYIEDRRRVEYCLEKIGYASKHLMSLINDVLDMSKIEEGKMAIAHEIFSLESVAESITSIIYPQALAKGLTFAMPLAELTDTVFLGDSMRLNQILLNLLSNALKFTPEGGSVSLGIQQLQKKNGRVRLSFTVTDTGIGMSEEFINRLFLPFEQENASTGQKYGGTGLGMSITKNLVTLMGGTISVSSKPEQGSIFTVELDFELAEAAEQTPAQHQQTLESLHVMIADDDRDCCIHTSLLLKNLSIRSDWVLTGLECVDKVLLAHKTGSDYDVCLIDWKMPDIDGVEVTRRIREMVGPDTTIIIITAYDWSAIESSARDAGANAFLSKPIFASTLYNTLLSVTGIEKTIRFSTSCETTENPIRLPKPCEMTENPGLMGRRVLLAEDNELNQEIAVEILKMAGLTIDCVSDGKQAVERFLTDKTGYDLILMDIQMPAMNGYQATEAIRKSDHPNAKTIPIIAMTANAFHEDVVLASEAGMNGHLAKPIDPKALYQLIEEVLRNGHRLSRASNSSI